MSYIEKLKVLQSTETSLVKEIARKLQWKVRNDIKIYKAESFAKELSISPSMISKFIKKILVQDWSTLRYIHNEIISNKKISRQNFNKEIFKIAELIEKSRKILLIGVSVSLFTNQDFAHKLERLDFWVSTPYNKYEQIGLSNLLTSKDLLIVNSVSLQHKWMENIMKNTKANVVLISANQYVADKLKIKNFIKINKTKHDSNASRTFTTKTRIKAIQVYDEIYELLISKPSNANLLRLTSYN